MTSKEITPTPGRNNNLRNARNLSRHSKSLYRGSTFAKSPKLWSSSSLFSNRKETYVSPRSSLLTKNNPRPRKYKPESEVARQPFELSIKKKQCTSTTISIKMTIYIVLKYRNLTFLC